ncbi:MAG: hypothetical protein KGL77_01015 [Actinomycetales bacterium]|nr:hypothetical protein [Actinomycetales bacterium]
MPSPYVIERPGMVLNTLGLMDGKPIIQMGEKTYPASGRLNLMTVSLVGSPEQTPSWFEIAQAWIDPAQVIIPVDEAFPANQTAEQSDAESKAMMEESQQDAVAAALIGLGYDVPRHLYVAEVFKEAPAAGKLVAKDFIEQANGVNIDSVETLRAVIKRNKTNPLTLVVNRAGKKVEQVIKPYLDGDTYRIGIFTGYTYDFPIKVTISTGEIGGPSGGMMFALAITDKLTPGSMTGGLNISGTGTIDPTGKVGAIGGIRQKMYAAVRADSKYFLAPAENCDEVVGAIPDGLNVFKVSTLTDAKNAISKLVAGAKPSSLPSCTK